jgi:hypothetical protein
MSIPPPDDPLDPLLDRWSSTPAPSPRLNAEVWQRIATGQSAGDRVVRGPWATFEAWLERPVFAVGFVAACALMGLFLAEVRVGQVQRDRNSQLARSYLQLIDPLVSTPASERRS